MAGARERLHELRTLLQDARAELDRWGHGDMHYGPMPRDPGIVAMLAKIDAVLGDGAPSLYELGFTRRATCADCGFAIFQAPRWNHAGVDGMSGDELDLDHKPTALLNSITGWSDE